MSESTKSCSRCKETFPATSEHFVATKSHLGKRIWTPECKSCRRAMWRAYYNRNREKMVARAVERITRLRREDPVFRERDRAGSRNRKRRQLADPMERTRHNQRGREWRRANPERARLFKHNRPEQRVARSAKRRALMLAAPGSHFTVNDMERHAAIQDHRCFWCLEPLVAGRREVDHVIPLSRGGDNSCENIVIACQDCNRRKGAKLPQEFMAQAAAA